MCIYLCVLNNRKEGKVEWIRIAAHKRRIPFFFFLQLVWKPEDHTGRPDGFGGSVSLRLGYDVRMMRRVWRSERGEQQKGGGRRKEIRVNNRSTKGQRIQRRRIAAEEEVGWFQRSGLWVRGILIGCFWRPPNTRVIRVKGSRDRRTDG